MPVDALTLFLGFPLSVAANFIPDWYYSLTRKPLEDLFFKSFEKVLNAQDKKYGKLFNQFVKNTTNKENREKVLNIFESGMDPENPAQALDLIQSEEFRNSMAIKIVKEFQLEENLQDTLALIVKESLYNYKESFFKHMSTSQGLEHIINQLLQIRKSLGQLPHDLAKKKDIDDLKELLQKKFTSKNGKRVTPEEPVDRSKLPLPGDLPERHRMPYRSLGNGFVGRVQDLWDIDESLRKNKTFVVQGVGVVTGMGGVGKTQLAVEYVHRFGKYYPGGVFWVEADQGFSSLLASICRAAGINVDNRLEEKTQLEQLWQILSSFSPVLVVLDNFPEKIGLEVWLPPQSSIHVLVTTRRKDFFKYSSFSIDVLTKEEAIKLLNSGIRKLTEDVSTLVETLGGLPLAIELAKNFLNLRTNLSIAVLLEEIKKKGEMKALAIFSKKYENELPTGHSKEIAATFQLSWDIASDFAKTVLQVIALLAPAPVPRRVLKKILDIKGKNILENPVDEAVGELTQKLSLSELDEDNDPACHRLISAFVRTVTKKDTDLISKIVRTIINEMARTKDAADTASLTELEKVLPHAAHLLTSKKISIKPGSAVELLDCIGTHHLHQGRFKIAEKHMRDGLQKAEENFKPGDPKIGFIQSDLGGVLAHLGEYKKAIEYFEKALASGLKTYGPEHPDVASSWSNLGYAWESLGQYKKAIEYFEKALSSNLKTYGSEHPDVALDWNNLGLSWKELGKYEKAISYYDKANEINIKHLGEEHPRVASTWNNLGLAYDSLGEYEKAIEFFEKALASDLKTYGPEHPSVALKWNNLGGAWYTLGQYKKAIEYFEKALASNLKTYGPEHPDVAIDRNSLGCAWKELGKYKKAIEFFEKALASDLKIYDPEHPVVAIRWINLGNAWKELGKYKKAIEYFEKALASNLKTYGPEHPDVATAWDNLGKAWEAQGQYMKAIEFFEKALASDLKTYDPEHPVVAIRWNNLSKAWEAQGQYMKAIEYIEKALASDLKTYGPEHPAVAVAWNNLGKSWKELGQYEKAIEYYEKALSSDLKTYGPEHPAVALKWNNLGSAYYSLAQYEKAIEYFEKALSSDLKTYSPEHPKVSTYLNNLGSTFWELGQYEQAMEYYEKALKIFETFLGKDHPNTKTVRNNLESARKKLK